MGEWSQVQPGCRSLPVSTRLGVLWSPHYLVMQLIGSEHSEASLKPETTCLVLNLPQANTNPGIKLGSPVLQVDSLCGQELLCPLYFRRDSLGLPRPCKGMFRQLLPKPPRKLFPPEISKSARTLMSGLCLSKVLAQESAMATLGRVL